MVDSHRATAMASAFALGHVVIVANKRRRQRASM